LQADAAKAALNAAKSRLDPLFADTNFDRFLGKLDLYRELRSRLKHTKHAQCVSNAWLKMFELCRYYRLLDTAAAEGVGRFRHFDNCALPGAFVSATNHCLRTLHPEVEYDWHASTLVPPRCLAGTIAQGTTRDVKACAATAARREIARGDAWRCVEGP